MKTLAIDYGEKKIGLAIASTPLAEAFGVISAKNWQDKIRRISQKEKIDRIIFGISEGKMAKKQRKEALALEKDLKIPVFLVDETLTSQQALAKMREVGRKGKEDQFAAALLLQQFLDYEDV